MRYRNDLPILFVNKLGTREFSQIVIEVNKDPENQLRERIKLKVTSKSSGYTFSVLLRFPKTPEADIKVEYWTLEKGQAFLCENWARIEAIN